MTPAHAAPCDNGLLQAALDQVAEMCWVRLPCERVTIMLADGEGRDAVLGIAAWRGELAQEVINARVSEIGRASCRERV